MRSRLPSLRLASGSAARQSAGSPRQRATGRSEFPSPSGCPWNTRLQLFAASAPAPCRKERYDALFRVWRRPPMPWHTRWQPPRTGTDRLRYL